MTTERSASALPAGSVRIHDDSQLEIKLDYLFGKHHRRSHYRLDLFFFMPVNFGVDERSYTREAFYRDLFGYVRLKTPRSNITGITEEFARIRQLIETSLAEGNTNRCAESDSAILLACCIFRATLRDFANPIREGKGDTADIPGFIAKVEAARKHVRALADIARTETVPIAATLIHADEYTSIAAEEYAFRMLRAAKKRNDDDAATVITRLVAAERDWRERHFPDTVATEDSDNSPLVFRGRILKKFFYRILFLSVRKKRSARGINQVLYAVGAGISMLFATAVAFYFQDQFGQLTFPFLVALVVSYMFKDRFKDLFRFISQQIIDSVGYDFDTKILGGKGSNTVGSSKERVRFVAHDDIPEDVLHARLPQQEIELSSYALGESVIQYEKHVRLSPGKIRKELGERITGLNDIIRFNIQEFTRRLDDSIHPVFVLRDHEAALIPAQNRYAFHLVSRIVSESGIETSAFRVSITKKGLLSITHL